MDLQLKGKTALVSGSSVGIGFAIAELLLKEGATVYINARSQQRVDEALKKLHTGKNGSAGKAEGIAADLGTADGVQQLIKVLPEVDILVNNVGMYEPKEFTQISDDDWTKIFDVNVMSGIRLSRHYLPGMLKRNWGRVIFISSESAVNIPREMIHYGMTKTAQLAVARGLAEMTAGTNVTVNSVLPGPTASEGVEQFVADMAKKDNKSKEEVESDFFKNVRPSSLIKRFATVEEVANLVAYVSSPLSAATNGAALRVEGGCVSSII